MNKFRPTAYMASLNIDVVRLGLTVVTDLLASLGNPQNSYATIMIAGTNGKGSTAAIIASILQHAGYKTGLYTSPHLVDVKERIRIDGKKISARDFGRTVAAVKQAMKQPASYFEVLTTAALLHFQSNKIDIAILEVGLGGRLDATNVCRPLVSVITNIDFDHTNYLGKSLTAIAREKAGIIKKRGICVTAARQKQVLAVLESTCRRNHAAIYQLGKDMNISRRRDGLVSYFGLYGNLDNLTLPLPGRHQLNNAALALAVIEIIGKKGFPADAQAIKKGLAATRWEARLEVLCRQPLFVVDGAHNPAGINVLCDSLKNDFTFCHLVIIFSALADKDYRKMLRKIAPLADKIIITQLQTPRAVPVSEIHDYLRKIGYGAVVTENVAEAVLRAYDLAGKQDMICAAGSLYLAGEIKQAFPRLVSCDKK